MNSDARTGGDREYCFQVTGSDDGQRLDSFLVRKFGPQLSRSQIQQLIKASCVYVDGRPVKAALRLNDGDQVQVTLPEAEPAAPSPERLPLAITYEDRHILVIDKPAGLVVHPGAGHQGGTLVNALLAHCRDDLFDPGTLQRPGIVHRLDKDTSGLMVIGKTAQAYFSLVEAFKKRRVDRAYLCLVHGQVKWNKSQVDAPIGRHPKRRLKMAVVSSGRPARTLFAVRKRFDGYTLLSAVLDTGRTHQIRVHAAYARHPVVGDRLYGSRRGNLGLERQFLHACQLGFNHPITEEALVFSSKLPDDLQTALDRAQ